MRGNRYLTYAVSRMKDLLLALLRLAVMAANRRKTFTVRVRTPTVIDKIRIVSDFKIGAA